MSDDIVVVDNGLTYETKESAIVAKNEADRAEQWAKYSEAQANLADKRADDAVESSDAAAQAATAAIEAKQYTETAVTDKNLIVVATDLKSTPSNIKTVAGSIDNVNTVGNDIENINAVAANKANIDKVAANKANIDKVATNIVNVNTVAKNIDNVNLLAPHTGAMEALAPDIMDVVTVAGITEQTKNVSENMAHVVAVDNNKANIDKAVANANNITTVATSINNVNAVAGNKANIDNVAANKTNINNVSENITAVNNVLENMADVKKAVQSANDAKLWAVGTIAEKPEGSSKYWAEQAQQTAQVYDASETVKGIVRLATSEEAESGLDDKTAITPLKLKQNIVDNVGRVNQLGFNGTLAGGVITFRPDQGTYELKAGYEYEIDLLFSAVGTIPDTTQLKIVNGTDTINIVNVLDSDYSKPTTYKAMKQVCRYDTEIGWRWIFNVRYSVASNGSKVFVMPATSIDVSDKVSKSGDTMSGTLNNNGIFVSQFDSINFIARSKSLVKGIAPTDSNKYVGYEWQDKNGQRLAYLGILYDTGGTKRIELHKLDNNLQEFMIHYSITIPNECILLRDGSHTLGNVDVNTWIKNQIQFQDRKATRIARIQPLLALDGTARLCLAASKGAESESSLVIGSDGYTYCPKPTDDSNTYAIATTNWAGGLNRKNTWKKLNTFEAQPETHINGNARYKSVCTGYAKGTAPATMQFGGISTTDKNGVEVATLYSSIDTNNAVTSALCVKQPTAAGTVSRAISIFCDKNGVFHTSCSVQSAEHNSIVTTIAHSTNYMRFGNGLQICWGAGTGVQVFPQPFKDTNYMIAVGDTSYHKYEGVWTSEKTTTQFKINNSNNAQWVAIGYWY